MARYCADCANMGNVSNNKGLFPCNSRKSDYNFVAANMNARDCNEFCEAWQSRRSESEREEMIRISHRHGYYIVTLVSEVLGLGTDNEYLNAFAYIRDIFMPSTDEYDDFIEDYEKFGPMCADILREAGSQYRIHYCQYLLESYLKPFNELVRKNRIDEGISLYIEMFNRVKEELIPTIKKENKLRK